jgi:hypothetical protein
VRSPVLEQLPHYPECRLGISPSLNKHVEDFALVVDGTPQVHLFPGDPDDRLVEVPSLAQAWAALPQLARDLRAEFHHPAPHRLIGDLKTAFGEKILEVAVAQVKRRYSQTGVGSSSVETDGGGTRVEQRRIRAWAMLDPRPSRDQSLLRKFAEEGRHERRSRRREDEGWVSCCSRKKTIVLAADLANGYSIIKLPQTRWPR